MPKLSGGNNPKASIPGVRPWKAGSLEKPPSGGAKAAGGQTSPIDREERKISKPWKAGSTQQMTSAERMRDLTRLGSTKHAG